MYELKWPEHFKKVLTQRNELTGCEGERKRREAAPTTSLAGRGLLASPSLGGCWGERGQVST